MQPRLTILENIDRWNDMNPFASLDHSPMTYQTGFVEPGVREVVLKGRVSFSDLDGLQEILDLARQPGLRGFRLDLTGITGIDSPAIGILLLIRDAVMAMGTSLEILSRDDYLNQLLSVTRVLRGRAAATASNGIS